MFKNSNTQTPTHVLVIPLRRMFVCLLKKASKVLEKYIAE